MQLRTDTPTSSLSVVVVIVGGLSYIQRCLEALRIKQEYQSSRLWCLAMAALLIFPKIQ